MNEKIIGREKECERLQQMFDSREAEFAAVFGRRRIGKTFLIRSFFQNKNCIFFQVSGIHNGSVKEQLKEFSKEICETFLGISTDEANLPKFSNWMNALEQLTKLIKEKSGLKKVVLFFDEFPWMATRNSKLLQAIDYYWNRYWVDNPKIKLIICGSAASWIIKNIFKNRGGLHNRVTMRLKLEPFNLYETKAFLHNKGIKLDNFQVLQIYMCLGGIPFYLKFIKKGLTAIQNINQICFQQEDGLFNEFDTLFNSLFHNGHIHEDIMKLIVKKREGMTRKEIEKSFLTRGGRLSIWLRELEEAGFISSFFPFGREKGVHYKVIDEFSLFYLTWVRPANKTLIPKAFTQHYWEQLSKMAEGRTWLGYAFENVCYKHYRNISSILNIPEGSVAGPWKYIPTPKSEEQGAQIDLLFERPDEAVNICEIKFCAKPYSIDKTYAKELIQKIDIYEKITKKVTKQEKQIFLSMITSSKMAKGIYAEELISSEVTLDDLFEFA